MMIYITDDSVVNCAKVHSDRVLMRQCLNIKLVHNALTWPHRKSRWAAHPTAWMWKDYAWALSQIGCLYEYEISRRSLRFKRLFNGTWHGASPEMYPWWWHDADSHVQNSHRQLLFARDPMVYSQWERSVLSPCLMLQDPYWPVAKDGTRMDLNGMPMPKVYKQRIRRDDPWF